MRELRVGIGAKHGPKSTIWKFWVQGNEIYATSRMFGKDVKVSLHSSGACQWSCTDAWVVKQPNAKNAERHMAKWTVQYPDGPDPLLAFRIAIPLTEVRDAPVPTDGKNILWISNAPPECTIQFLLFVTCAKDEQPPTEVEQNWKHLASMQLRNKRWFCIFAEPISLSASDIADVRGMAIGQMKAAGIDVQPEYRLVFFSPPASNSAALLEVCATPPSPPT